MGGRRSPCGSPAESSSTTTANGSSTRRPPTTAWTVIDQINCGAISSRYWMIYDDREGLVPPVKATNVSMVEADRYVEAGLWHTADTIPELAAAIGVDPENLASTVKRFNEFAATGVDEDFGR